MECRRIQNEVVRLQSGPIARGRERSDPRLRRSPRSALAGIFRHDDFVLAAAEASDQPLPILGAREFRKACSRGVGCVPHLVLRELRLLHRVEADALPGEAKAVVVRDDVCQKREENRERRLHDQARAYNKRTLEWLNPCQKN